MLDFLTHSINFCGDDFFFFLSKKFAIILFEDLPDGVTYTYYSIHKKQLNVTFPTFPLLIFSVSEPLLVITSELKLTLYVPKNLWFYYT